MSKVQFLLLDKNLITDTNISDKEYRIYTYLLYLYNAEKKGSYPSLETISNALNISVTTVKKSIKNLVNLGYMKIEKEKCSKGYFNIYKNFKHLITSRKKRKSVKKKDDIPVDSNGEKPLDGQVHVDELLDSATPELQANKVTPVDLKEIELISNETGLEKEKAEQLLKIAEPKKILEVYEYAKSRAKNLYSFMFKAIKDNWNIQSVVLPVYENIEAGRGNYISNNKKRFTKKFSVEEIRKAEELENALLGWV